MPYFISILFLIISFFAAPLVTIMIKPSTLLTSKILVLLTTAIVYIVFIRIWKIKIRFSQTFSFRKCLTYILLGLGIRYAHIIFFLLFPQAGMSMYSKLGLEYYEALLDTFKNPFVFVYLSFLGPVLEELFFRGKVLTAIQDKGGTTRAIIISALLFGITHMNPVQFISAMCLGLLCGYVYTITNDIKAPIIIHIANNLSSQLEALTLDSYSEYNRSFYGIMFSIAIGIAFLAYGIRQCVLDKNKNLEH